MSDLDAKEFARYLSAQFHTQNGIEEALALLRTRRKLTGDPEERRAIDVELGALQEESHRISDERTAFMAENLAVVPPGGELLENLKGIADRLDKMVASSVTASVIIKASTDILNNWKKTRSA